MAKITAKRATKAEFTTKDSFSIDLGGADRGPREPQLQDRMFPFVLSHHPDAWAYIAGKIVPYLAPQVLTPGVNGVASHPDGRIKTGIWKAALEDRGQVVIEQSWAPNAKGYLQKLSLSYGDVYLTVWEQALSGSKSTTADMRAYAEWAGSLVDKGYLAPPSEVALERGLVAARSALATGLRAHEKGVAVDVAALRAEVDAWLSARTEPEIYESGSNFAPDLD